jgi:hypothetical protein
VHYWTGTDKAGDKTRVKSAFKDHQTYGTPQALETEISQDINYTVKVLEFFEAGLNWPDFAVEVPIEPDILVPSVSKIMAAALRRKNVRDWPQEVRFKANTNMQIGFAASPQVRAIIHIFPVDPTPRAEIIQSFGVAGNLRATIHLRAL